MPMFSFKCHFQPLIWIPENIFHRVSFVPLRLKDNMLGLRLIFVLCPAEPITLDRSQPNRFSCGQSRWQSSSWLQASSAGRSTAETCRCHIVLVVTNPITPGSLGTHTLSLSQTHTQAGNACWYERTGDVCGKDEVSFSVKKKQDKQEINFLLVFN